MTTDSSTPTPAEPLFLVTAGGDGYQAEIVPASKLDDAYLLTQWGTLADIDPDQRTAALEHFHDPDEWLYMGPLRGGKDRVAVEFSISFEDGWVRVVRLPDRATPSAAAEPLSDEQIDELLSQLSTIAHTYFDEYALPTGDYAELVTMRAAVRAALATQPARNGGEMGEATSEASRDL
jgi:hypothetical protein